MQKTWERYQPNHSRLIPTEFVLSVHKIFGGKRSYWIEYCCWNRWRRNERVDWSNKFHIWWEKASRKIKFDEDKKYERYDRITVKKYQK